MTGTVRIIIGDALEQLALLPDQSVHCCVTSPPYYGLRDYGVDGQIGKEKTPEAYVSKLVEVFREVRRVLRDDGTLWLNLGDSYGGYHGNKNASYEDAPSNKGGYFEGQRESAPKHTKQLFGIPWRVAFALQADGWILRQDIIWHKPNPMPESVRDRCTKSHEYIFLFAKSQRYYFDQDAILEPCSPNTHARLSQDVQNQIGSNRANGGAKTNGTMKAVGRGGKTAFRGQGHDRNGSGPANREGRDMKTVGVGRKYDPAPGNKNNASFDAAMAIMPLSRNRRSVWTVTTKPYKGAHFATFPPQLIEPCILAGCPADGTVLDPFGGSGTTGQVAKSLWRNAILIELNPTYKGLIEKRIS